MRLSSNMMEALAFATVLFALLSCASVNKAPGDLPSPDAGPTTDLPQRDDLSGDEASPDLPFDLTSLCPHGDPKPPPLGLIPTPYKVFEWGEETPVKALSYSGADPIEAAEVKAIATAKDLPLSQQADLHIAFYPTDTSEEVERRCGFEEESVSYYLVATRQDQGVTVSIFATTAEGRFYALKTLKQLLRNGRIRPTKVLDRPALPFRGLLEGFYGKPWSQKDRLSIIPLLADLKMNVYAYAPKGDYSISVLWKAPLLEEDSKRIKEVVEVAKSQRMKVCWEIRPVVLLVFSSQEDLEAMVAKSSALASLGVDCILLAFDDTDKVFDYEDQKVYGSYVEGLVDFANRLAKRLRAELPHLMLVFVPREYWLNAPDVQTDLKWLGEHLDPAWEIAWTGNEIVSPTVTSADADAYAAIVKRKPFLGDNFPVTDDSNETGVLNLGPLTGRSPDLAEHIKGISFNPSPLPFASLLGVATGADFAWNPLSYAPLLSLSKASLWLASDEAAWAVELLGQTNQVPPFAPSPAEPLKTSIDAFVSDYEAGKGLSQASQVLRETFERFAKVPSAFEGSDILEGFAREVRPWAQELGAWGEAGLLALDLLEALSKGDKPDEALVTALKQQYEDLVASRPKPTGDIMPSFIAWALERLQQ